jgi:TetR/AcrR family hemagglutinin/protease transcriptional regulator
MSDASTTSEVAPYSADKIAAPRVRAKRLTPAARREQIIQSAILVFADHGVGHTNHSQVAETAGISLPLVFVHFPTHEDLTLAVVDEVARFLIDEVIKPTLRDRHDGDVVIEEMLLNFARSIDTHRDYVRIWLDWSTSIRGTIWQRFLSFNSDAILLVRDAIKRGQTASRIRSNIHAVDAAHVVVALGQMIAQMVFGGAPRSQVTRTIRSLVRGYLREI